jgi:hypothetical protein
MGTIGPMRVNETGGHAMSTKEQLIAAVRGLVQAENDASRAGAERYISPSFAVISRSRPENQDQDREAMLKEIADPPAKRERTLDEASFQTWPGEAPTVVRSTVIVRNPDDPGEPKRFRNLHVFQDEDGEPRCIAWFVAEIPKPA